MTIFETCPICEEQVHEYDGTLQAHITTQHRYPELVEACRKAHDLLSNVWREKLNEHLIIDVRNILEKELKKSKEI